MWAVLVVWLWAVGTFVCSIGTKQFVSFQNMYIPKQFLYLEKFTNQSANIPSIDETVFLTFVYFIWWFLLFFSGLLYQVNFLRWLLLLLRDLLLLGIEAVLILVVSLIRILRLINLCLIRRSFIQTLQLFKIEYGAHSFKYIGLTVADADFHKIDN